MKQYDVCIIGAGPAGYSAAYKISQNSKLKIALFEKGFSSFEKHSCPIQEGKTSKCCNCKVCAVMNGMGGSGSKSDLKFNITNEFGGELWKKIGSAESFKLQEEVDEINLKMLDGLTPKLYNSNDPEIKKSFLEKDLHLLSAKVRHLGTDNAPKLLNGYEKALKDNGVELFFGTEILSVKKDKERYVINGAYSCKHLIVSVGRSGSKWLEQICDELSLKRKSNRIDIGVRVELPYEIMSDLTDKLYEPKIVYRTKSYNDFVRTFCVNPKGMVVNENTNGIITVNGHSYEDPAKHTKNTNFALLVSQEFTEPFNSSNEYGESVAKLSNMLGGGVIVQRFGDLIRYRRSTVSRLASNTVYPTLKATPGDLSLVLPHRILEDIKEMIYALDTIAPGTKNDDNLLYGVEVKFYNNVVDVDDNLKASDNLYIIGDGSGWTHSLSQAAASGLYVAKKILEEI